MQLKNFGKVKLDIGQISTHPAGPPVDRAGLEAFFGEVKEKRLLIEAKQALLKLVDKSL